MLSHLLAVLAAARTPAPRDINWPRLMMLIDDVATKFRRKTKFLQPPRRSLCFPAPFLGDVPRFQEIHQSTYFKEGVQTCFNHECIDGKPHCLPGCFFEVYERSVQSLRLTLGGVAGIGHSALHSGEMHYRLGWIRILAEYAFGGGCPRDGSTPYIDTEKVYGEALKPWAKAGSEGHASALFALSQVYHTGLMGTKDVQQQKAQVYSQLAANQEHTLALDYINGSLAERHQEYHEELDWFHSRALEQLYFVIVVTLVLGAAVGGLIWCLQTQDFSFLLEPEIEEEEDEEDEDLEEGEESEESEYEDEEESEYEEDEYGDEDGDEDGESEVVSSTDFSVFSTDDDIEKAKPWGKVHFD
jgi:hypothetical protein